jgi:DNA-binding transcriptional regulator/RsmH inhibitor MraZ
MVWSQLKEIAMDKDKVLAIAEDISQRDYKKHYYELGLVDTLEVWRKAEQDYNDTLASKADAERARLKEGAHDYAGSRG